MRHPSDVAFGLVLLLLVLLLWLGAGLTGTLQVAPPGLGAAMAIPATLLFAAGVLGGMAVVLVLWWNFPRPEAPPHPVALAVHPMVLGAATALGVLLLGGVMAGQVGAARAVTLLALLAAALLLARQLMRMLDRGEAVELRNHWGGLGGGLGGWRISPAAVLLLLALGFATAAAGVGLGGAGAEGRAASGAATGG